MKLRNWLLVSYLIVMLLPLIAAYGLFILVTAYYEERNVAEYMEGYLTLNQHKAVLEEPTLYRPNADFSVVEDLVSEQVYVTLYNDVGFTLYSTNPVKQTVLSFIPKRELYEGFYEQQQNFGTIRYKEPVFTGSTLIGVYEIEWARDEWVSGVGQRTWLVVGLLAVFFIVVFTVVAYLVNRKLNQPLQKLTKQMNAFAKGLPVGPIRKSKDELGELAESFASMRSELIEVSKKLTDEQKHKEYMIASISHDLKTPLTSIRAYAEALESGALSVDEQKEYRDIIVEKSVFMRQMLDDLLMYTLLQSTNYTMDSVIVDGEEFFDMLVSGYETLCHEKGIELQVMTDVSGTFAVNSKQLIRVVDNLMVNAMTHTAPGNTIWLAAVNVDCIPNWCFDFIKESLHEKDGMYLLVQNEGPGISDEQLEKVFEPLYQADEARSKVGDGGTGLGLSITQQIIEKHGGTVQMLSGVNTGTAVICYVPETKGEE